MGELVHIDDLASPRFSTEVQDMRAAMLPLAATSTLDAADLHREAATATGLTDFGPDDYRERLEVLLGALRHVDGVTPSGRVGFHAQILQLLQNRLLLIDLLRRHPEIHDVELRPPIIIAGLPRTGTTHLHNLMAADPAFRTLPYWESLEPIPRPSELGVEPDPRRTRTDAVVWFINQAMPLFPLMHEMTTDHVHEEIQLLAIDFSTMFFETLASLPDWRAYYRSHDQTPHYQFLRTTLQALQHLRPGERWLLKSPQHLEQLPVLTAVFPDATVVITHRDPVEVVVSMATMIAYSARSHADAVDPTRIGREWAARIEIMLNACVADRDVIPPDRSLDVRFDDLLADDLGMARRVCELAGHPPSRAAEEAMATYLAGHERGRLGRIDYRAGDVGLDRTELKARFTTYTERFL